VAAACQSDTGRRGGGLASGFDLELLSSAEGRLVSERFFLMRELKPGEAPGPGEGSIGRFAYDPGAFARAESFFRGALSEADVLGLDEIGALELARGEGLRPCLDLALDAFAGGEPRRRRLLVCAARDGNVGALRELVEARGLAVSVYEPELLPSAIDEARRILASPL
jgi:hypothetical protein